MNYITELNKLYHWCMSKKQSKSEIALLQALYMADNAEDWAVWFEADNEYIQRLTGGLSRESINEARNKLKQQGRIDFVKGTRNVESAKYRIIPFVTDEQGNERSGKSDIAVDKEVDMKVDKGVDKEVDTLSKLNKPNENLSFTDEVVGGSEILSAEKGAGEKKPENVSKPNVIEIDADVEFEKAYANYPRKEGKVDGKKLYLAYLTSGREIKGQAGRVRFNHAQLRVAIMEFAAQMETEGRERDKIKHFGTFMNAPVIEYAEKSAEFYEASMVATYGEKWRSLKFEYKFKK